MTFEYEAPDEFASDGNYLKVGGTYHLAIIGIGIEGKDGKMLDGFRVNFEVLDGTTRDKHGCTEAKKQTNVTFFNGKLTDKDSGKFRRQIQTAFLVAAGIFDSPAKVAAVKAKQAEVNLEEAMGRQLVATLEVSEKGYMELKGTSIYHVDDPAAASFPKNDKALALMPATLRRKPEELEAIKAAFGGAKPASNGGGGNGSGGTAPAPGVGGQTVGAGATASSLDDL